MAKKVSNFIRVTVPINLLRKNSVLTDALLNLARIAGGGTSHEANGAWFDGNGNLHDERVYVYQFNFADLQAHVVDAAARRVVDLLFSLGEEAVMKERNYTERTARILNSTVGYVARIIHAPPHMRKQIELPLKKLPDVIADDQSARHLQLTH